MPISHTFTLGFSNGSLAESKQYVVTADGETNIDLVFKSTTSIQVVNINLTASLLQGLFINSQYLTELRTNDTATYGDLFTLQADTPMVWTTKFVLANPFTTDVTDYRFYNTSGTDSRVRGFHAVDVSVY